MHIPLSAYSFSLLFFLTEFARCDTLLRHQNSTWLNAMMLDSSLSSASCHTPSIEAQQATPETIHSSSLPTVAPHSASLEDVAWSVGNLVSNVESVHTTTQKQTQSHVVSPTSKPVRTPRYTERLHTSSSPMLDEHPESTPSDDANRPASTPDITPTNADPEPAGTNPLAGWKILLCLVALASNTALQRSGADELPWPGSISLARLSPLVCLADTIVVIITVVWSMLRGGLTIRAGIAVYLYNTCHADARQPSGPARNLRSLENVLKVPTCCVGLWGALTILCTYGLSSRLYFCTAIFFASPAIYLILRILGRNADACEMARVYVERGMGDTMLLFADGVWCLAYVFQFGMWVQVAQQVAALPAMCGEHSAITNYAIMGSIGVAVIVSACSPKRMFKLWSVRNWSQSQINYCLMAAFVLALAINMPDSDQSLWMWRQNILVPLGAFSIVVLEIWIVASLKDSWAWCDGFAAGLQPLRDEAADQEAPEKLQRRWNPMLNSTPDRWRETLMVAFMLSQFTFAAMYFGAVYDDGGTETRMPAWLDDFF